MVLGCMCDRTKLLAILLGAAGGAVAIAGMEAFSARTAFPLVAIPFATSIVTVLGSPKADAAQPRALIGGHLVSTFVGLLILTVGPWSMDGCARGWTCDGRNALYGDVSPAGGDRSADGGSQRHVLGLLVAPVGIGAISLALFAFAWHCLAA
jgi:hypothetical protein